MTSITNIDDLRDRRGHKVCGVITRENQNCFSFGCFECDASFLSVDNYKRHVNTMHQRPRLPLAIAGPSTSRIETKISIVISSDEEEMDIKPSYVELMKCLKRPERKLNQRGNDSSSSSDSSDSEIDIRRQKKQEATRKHAGNECYDARLYKCDECPKTYDNKHGLMLHVRVNHKTKFKYWCPMCPYGSDRFTEVEIHKEDVHARTPLRHKCNVCNKNFATMFAIKDHMKTKHPYKK